MNATPSVHDSRQSSPERLPDQPLPSTRGLWIPLVAVILVLATLVVLPIVVSARLRRQRGLLSDVIDPARVRATNLTAFLAEEMFAVGMGQPTANPGQDPRYVAALASEHRAAFALDSLLRFSDPDAVEQFGQYREAATRWHDGVDAMVGRHVSGGIGDSLRAEGVATLTAARRLVQTLEQMSTEHRAEVRRAERFDVLLPGALFPLALLACVLVVRAGRRTVAIALRAEADRRALALVMDQKSAFMRGISHDLQNPLGAALGNVELILDGVVEPEEQQNALVRVRRLIRTASDTVAALLTVARSDSGAIEFQPRAIELVALVRAAIEDHAPLERARRQSVELLAPDECRALGDGARVRHIVDNLLSNSSKYTPEGGRVRVAISRLKREGHGGAWSTVTVEDSGPGVPPEWHERVFEEFARVPGSREVAPGHGIGLAVSRRVARIMDGDLTIAPTGVSFDGRPPLGGAVFTLWLPSADVTSDKRLQPPVPRQTV